MAILSQPDWHSCEPWRTFGRPRLCFAVSAGNMDSMLNHYTASRKVRNDDAYSPGGADRPAARPRHAGLLPAGPRGLPRRAGDRRRRRGQPAAAGPLRLLERQGPPLDPARRQGRPGGLRHGRAAVAGDRPPPGRRASRSGRFATSAALRIDWAPAKRPWRQRKRDERRRNRQRETGRLGGPCPATKRSRPTSGRSPR